MVFRNLIVYSLEKDSFQQVSQLLEHGVVNPLDQTAVVVPTNDCRDRLIPQEQDPGAYVGVVVGRTRVTLTFE